MAAPQRNRLIGAVHAAKKAAELDDDTYRAMLDRITGKSSAKDLSDGELRQVLDHMNGGAKRIGHHTRFAPPKTTSPTAKKARALWISLQGLGAISDPSEQALRAWVKRQHHVDDIAFVRPSQSFAVIEGLKQWCTRLGVDWASYNDPRRCVIARQVELAQAKGCEFLPGWGRAMDGMADGELDQTIAMLGRMVRGEHG
jgi:hypothetical protein